MKTYKVIFTKTYEMHAPRGLAAKRAESKLMNEILKKGTEIFNVRIVQKQLNRFKGGFRI